MPVNRKYPLAELFDACREYQASKKQKISFEYILIKDLNDSPEQARELGRQVRRFDAKVNLIPYNTVTGFDWERPGLAEQDAFLKILTQHGASATIRREKGHDINAACGQLRLRRQKDVEPATLSS
jgi:23S rRNA (adenine2503-C2)-methyltransferase